METEQLHSEGECAYFNLAMLFFAELGSEGSLEVDLLDTLFFLPDHSISYLYKVPPSVRRTLARGSSGPSNEESQPATLFSSERSSTGQESSAMQAKQLLKVSWFPANSGK